VKFHTFSYFFILFHTNFEKDTIFHTFSVRENPVLYVKISEKIQSADGITAGKVVPGSGFDPCLKCEKQTFMVS
jgi:hypothetical protein